MGVMLRALCVVAAVSVVHCGDTVTNVHELCVSAEAHASDVEGWVADVCNAYQIVAKAQMLIEEEAEHEHTHRK